MPYYQEQLNVLVMGSATSTLSSRRRRWRRWRQTKHRVDIVPATVTEGMRKVKHLTVNLTQIAATITRKQPLLGSSVCPSGTTGEHSTSQHRGATPGSMYEPNQFVMNCGVVDPSAGPIRMSSLLSLATSTTATRSLSSSVLLSMGRLPLSLLLFAMQSPSTKSQFRWMDGWAMGNTKFPSPPIPDVIAIIYITLT